MADLTNLLARKACKDAILGCTNCALSQVARAPVPFYGPSPASVAVVGEAPGRMEDVQGRPFVGPAGQLARGWLSGAGLDPESVAWLNVVSCFPNRTPTNEEVEACRHNLASQLSVVSPQYLLVLGGVALSAWWPKLRIGEMRGLWWREGRHGTDAWAMATWHPAAVLRNRSLEAAAREDLEIFGRVARGEVIAPPNLYCIKCGAGEAWGADYYDEDWIPYCEKHRPNNPLSGGRKTSGKTSGKTGNRPRSTSSSGKSKAAKSPKPQQETLLQD